MRNKTTHSSSSEKPIFQSLAPHDGHCTSVQSMHSHLPTLPAPVTDVLNELPQMVCLVSGDGSTIFLNTQWRQCLATGKSMEATFNWLDSAHPEDRTQLERQWKDSQKNRLHSKQECRLRHADGVYHWFLVQIQPTRSLAAHQDCWQITCSDIDEQVSAQHALAESLYYQKKMLDVSVDCIKTLNLDGTVLHMNQSGCMALLGSCDSNMRFGMKWLDLLPKEVRRRGQRALGRARAGKNARFAGMSVAGSKVQYWDNILTPVLDATGKVTGILCVSRDVTLQRQAEKRLRMASELDELTGLPNRRAFKCKLKRIIQKSEENSTAAGLMLLDLDHFKHINDTLGHIAGDHLLKVLSRRLAACLPPKGLIARLGGDEFAVIVDGLRNMEEMLQIAQQLQRQLDAPVHYAGKTMHAAMSIGCAMAPRDAMDFSGLMKCADTALNDIKASGRGGIRMYGVRMMQATLRKAAQLDCARYIVRNDSIVPHYQPKVMLADGHIIGFEALLRWQGSNGKLHTPNSVREAFTDYELATKISDLMRHKVFTDMQNWMQAGLSVAPVSFNASPVEFLRDDFATRFLTQLHAFQISPTLVELEVTEHILGERNSDYVARALRVLKQEGVQIALDDFGTGHSSFVHLRDFPVDCIKIDSGFVRRMLQAQDVEAIVHSVCKLGPSLGLKIVAEGVETLPQRNALLKAGCQMGQGYLFSPAVATGLVPHLLTNRRAPSQHLHKRRA